MIGHGGNGPPRNLRQAERRQDRNRRRAARGALAGLIASVPSARVSLSRWRAHGCKNQGKAAARPRPDIREGL